MKLKIDKAFMRIKMILKEFFLKSKYYSLSYAIYSTAWWLGWYIVPLRAWAYWGLKKKTDWMDKYFRKNYSHIIEKYKNYEERGEIVDDYNIWVFWAQGEDNMPELVKACYKNLCKLNGDCVKLLTMENLGDYVELPHFVFDKLERGTMTYTHFSDLLRVSLLAKYGGMWVDSTCWIAKEVLEDVKNMSFWSCKTANANVPLWSNSRWCGWAMGTNKKNKKLFSFILEMLLLHAKDIECLIDYLFLDYLLLFSCNLFESSREEILNVKENNLNRGVFWSYMNEKYDNNKYQELTEETWIFKLSYKTILNKKTEGGDETFYGKLISGEL